MNAIDLHGVTAAVTGAASGIGRAIALRFASHGAAVRLVDVNLEAAQAVADEITRTGGIASAHLCDLTSASSVASTFSALFQHEKIGILVNSAGISHIGNVENTSVEDFDRVFTVNARGVFLCMQSCVPHMVHHGGGIILNLASIAATAGLADRFAYSMSKGAVLSMTLSVARDYIAHNIRCNCISPARIHTPFVDNYIRKTYPGREQEMFDKLSHSQPIGRMGAPEEIAALALYLCSSEAGFITGADIPIDGGFFNLHG